MTLKTEMADDLGTCFNSDEFGTDVYYNGAADAIVGILDYGDGNQSAEQATVMVQKSDVPAPKYQQAFVIDGETWIISGKNRQDFIATQDNDTVTLRIRRKERYSGWPT